MATLKQELKFLDTLMNHVTKKEFYLVLKENLHNVWVIDVEGKEEPKELPKKIINLAYVKVNPQVAKVLYGEENDQKIDAPVTDSGEPK